MFSLKDMRFFFGAMKGLALARTWEENKCYVHSTHTCPGRWALIPTSSYQREDVVTSATQHDVKPNLKAFPMLIIGEGVLSTDGPTHLFHT